MAAMDSLKRISRETHVLIAGPTASGKSALAMALAARDGRIIVNADALQAHDAWRLLTARPSAADEALQRHALYGHVAKTGDYSVGHWLREVAPLLAQPVVIVGGTGLYFMALMQGLAVIPPIPPDVRAMGDALRLSGQTGQMAAALDAQTAARIDLANPARVQRAWEVARATGRGLADWQADTGAPLIPARSAQTLVIDADRDRLNLRIDARFETMLAGGVMDEIRANAAGFDPARPWARAIGAAELTACLTGAMPRATAVSLAKIATHQYAKRQRTWFRARMADWTWLEMTGQNAD